MALTIQDLPQSDDLDRQAMRQIAGGARTGARPVKPVEAAPRGGRIVDYPPGFGSEAPKSGSSKAEPAKGSSKAT
jgi:hypothetical protein